MQNKLKCPYCDKEFFNLWFHIKRKHKKSKKDIEKDFGNIALFASWNNNLTAKDDVRVKENGKKVAEVRKSKDNYYTWNKGLNCKKYNWGRKKNCIAWNKGLTARTDERVRMYAEKWNETMQNVRKLFKNGERYTKLEKSLYEELEKSRIEYEPQKPLSMKGLRTRIDAYIKPRICIYIDGEYWHNLPGSKEKDKYYNKVLKENGFKVIRIPEKEWYQNKTKFIAKIKQDNTEERL